jgi:hypothetical protein
MSRNVKSAFVNETLYAGNKVSSRAPSGVQALTQGIASAEHSPVMPTIVVGTPLTWTLK